MQNRVMQIRPMTLSDQEKVAHLLQELWGYNPLMLRQYQVHRGDWPITPNVLRKSIVVETGGEIVAAGTLFESTLHPRYHVVAINVAQAWQGQGIGTRIYDRFKADAGSKPWMVKSSRSDQAGERFLKKRDYHEVANSILGAIDPTHQEVKDWLEKLPAEIDGYQVVQMSDNPSGVSRLVLARLLAQIYTQYHRWNPPSRWSDERIVEIFVGASTIPGTELVLLDHNMPIGAAVLFREAVISKPSEGYLVHVGVLGLDHPKAAILTKLLIRHEMEIAAQKELCVRFEADNEYVPQRELFESAPVLEINRDLYVMAEPLIKATG